MFKKQKSPAEFNQELIDQLIKNEGEILEIIANQQKAIAELQEKLTSLYEFVLKDKGLM